VDRVPPDWLIYEQQQSKVSKINRHASHPANAILNYTYAALESQVRIAASMIGFDTGVACPHAMKHGRSSLIYDLIEPLRPLADRKMYEFVQTQEFNRLDLHFSVQGVCRIADELGRRLVSAGLRGELIFKRLMHRRDKIFA